MYKRLKERSKRVDNNCSGDVDDNDENKKDARHQHRLRVIKKLDEIGFSWTKPKKVTPFFPQLADELKDFQLQHGHCNVPYVLYQDQYIDNQCQPHDPSNVNKRNEGDNEEKDGATKMQLGKFVHTMVRALVMTVACFRRLSSCTSALQESLNNLICFLFVFVAFLSETPFSLMC